MLQAYGLLCFCLKTYCHIIPIVQMQTKNYFFMDTKLNNVTKKILQLNSIYFDKCQIGHVDFILKTYWKTC